MREGLPFPRRCGGKGLIIKASLAWGPSPQDPPLEQAGLGFRQIPWEMRLSVHLTAPSCSAPELRYSGLMVRRSGLLQAAVGF